MFLYFPCGNNTTEQKHHRENIVYQSVSCLMSSKTIAAQLSAIAAGARLDKPKLSVIFGLVFAHTEFENADVDAVVKNVKLRSETELKQLAKEIHPVLCSMHLALEKGPGGENWRAERARPRGRGFGLKALHLNNGVVYAG